MSWGNGLDEEVRAVGCGLEVRCRPDSLEGRVPFAVGHLPPLDAALEVRLDVLDSRPYSLLVDVVETDVVARHCRHLGDAVTHASRTDDSQSHIGSPGWDQLTRYAPDDSGPPAVPVFRSSGCFRFVEEGLFRPTKV